MHLITLDHREELLSVFRDMALLAMDKAMNRIAHEQNWAARDNCTGARDADLPELFKGIDAQFDRNLAHLGVIVRDPIADDMDKADQRCASQ